MSRLTLVSGERSSVQARADVHKISTLGVLLYLFGSKTRVYGIAKQLRTHVHVHMDMHVHMPMDPGGVLC